MKLYQYLDTKCYFVKRSLSTAQKDLAFALQQTCSEGNTECRAHRIFNAVL